jgi:hypothetical protein
MITIRLEDLLARIDARKKALGTTDTPAEVEALRNSGSTVRPRSANCSAASSSERSKPA